MFDSHAALIEALQRDLAAVAGTRQTQDQEQEVKQMHETTGAPSHGALQPAAATLLVKGSRGSAMTPWCVRC